MSLKRKLQLFLTAILVCHCNQVAGSELGTNATSALVLAGAFRSTATLDIASAVKAFSADNDPAGLLSAPLRKVLPECWGPFFSGTYVLGGESRSSTPVFAFYNPYLDIALFTTWRRTPKIQIKDAWWSFAPWVESSSSESNHLTDPTQLPDPLIASERLRLFETNFSKGFSLAGADVIDGPPADHRITQELFVQRRIFVSQMAFANFERLDDTAPTRPWRDWAAACKSSDTNAVNSFIKEGMTITQAAICAVPLKMRRGIETLHAIRSDNRLLTFAWNPQTPAIVLFSDYANSNGWRLQNAAVMQIRK